MLMLLPSHPCSPNSCFMGDRARLVERFGTLPEERRASSMFSKSDREGDLKKLRPREDEPEVNSREDDEDTGGSSLY